MKTTIIITITLMLLIAFKVSSQEKIKGNFLGQNINTSIDSKIAAYYFNKLIGNTISNPNYDTVINKSTFQLQERVINNNDMAILTNTLSVDFATLFFAQRMYSEPKNKEAQNLFQSYIISQDNEQTMPNCTNVNEYAYVFVPGLFYIRHSELGGDFKTQREQLNQMGLTTYLIEINEVGTVLENAQIIAKELKRLSATHQKMVVVSASKGGPDLAYALGKLMSWNESKSIKAWISLGGVLRGSQVADNYLTGLNRLYAKTILFFAGGNIDFVEDLSIEKSIDRFNSLCFPEDLLIIHYVGAPLSSQVSKKVKKNFNILSKMGPNDGLTTLIDELTPQGIVITELGLDHFYKDENIDKKTIALMYTALDILKQKENNNKKAY